MTSSLSIRCPAVVSDYPVPKDPSAQFVPIVAMVRQMIDAQDSFSSVSRFAPLLRRELCDFVVWRTVRSRKLRAWVGQALHLGSERLRWWGSRDGKPTPSTNALSSPLVPGYAPCSHIVESAWWRLPVNTVLDTELRKQLECYEKRLASQPCGP